MERTHKIQKEKSKVIHSEDSEKTVESQKKLNINGPLLSKAIQHITTLSKKPTGETTDLLEMNKNPFIYLTVLVNELPTKVHVKPVPLSLKHSLHGPEFNTRCFFITTNAFKKDNKELLRDLKNPWKFVSYDQFRNKYHEYKDRLSLLKEYDLFFCDARIYSILKKHCGVHFYRQKKYPCPVDFSTFLTAGSEQIGEKDLREVLNGVVENKTYFVQGNGPEYGVKIGRLEAFGDEQALDNCKKALKGVLALLVERGLKLGNLRRVSVKGEQTESFPLFTHLTPAEKKIVKEISVQAK